MTAPTDHPTPGSVLTEADVAAGWKLHDGGPNPVPGGDVSLRWGFGIIDRQPSCKVNWSLKWIYRLSRPQPATVSEHVSGDAKEGVEAAVERKSWRCFHCDDVFDTSWAARAHFGATEDAQPACKIAAGEGGLLEAMRRAEADAAVAWQMVHDENTDAAKAYRATTGRHAEQNRAAEQAGYDRGLADAKAHPETLGLCSLASHEAQAAKIADLKARIKALEEAREAQEAKTVEAVEGWQRADAAIKALQRALRPLAIGKVHSLSDEDDIPDGTVGSVRVTMGDIRRARTLTEAGQ